MREIPCRSPLVRDYAASWRCLRQVITGVGVDTGSRVFSVFYVDVRGQRAIATRRELSSADGN